MQFQKYGEHLRPMAHRSGLPDAVALGGAACERDWLGSLSCLDTVAAEMLARRNEALRAGLRGNIDPCEGAHGQALLPEGLDRLLTPTEFLLASGGDDRLTLNPATGLNRYQCAPWPRPEVIAFGSCTASSPSPRAFAAAEQGRRALVESAIAVGTTQALAAATKATEEAVLDYFQVADLACALLTASGTDAALAVTGLLQAEWPDEALTSVLVSPAETGSGVPLAVQGRHFAPMSPDGRRVEKGDPLPGLSISPKLRVVALRGEDGQARAPADIVRSCEAEIVASLGDGRAVLHAIDGSKTGLAAPDRPALLRLAKRFGDRLDVVVDACQARIEPALVRWYLSQGFIVLVTGSKFFAAPGFCGAVLFPRARLACLAAQRRLASGVSAYMRQDGGLGSRLCPGLLLRWAAALSEMQAFACLSPEQVGHRLDMLGDAVRSALGRDPRLELIDAPRPAGMGWSDRRSVFTFCVHARDRRLSMAELRPIYLDLQNAGAEAVADGASGPADPANCQIGQPVELGGPSLGGLRIAISAAQVTDRMDPTAALHATIAKLGGLLDRLEATRRMDRFGRPALVSL